MKARSSARPGSPHPRFLGVLAFLVLAGCASAPAAQEGHPAADSVDIGYGRIDRDQVTGAVSTISGEDEATQRPRTLAEMLSRVPGVRVSETPGGGLSVRIRGAGSFLGGEEPLFVIDGMPIQSADAALRGLNSSNIESVTVLKDAGQTAVYGSRGANGVILIKTKKGSG